MHILFFAILLVGVGCSHGTWKHASAPPEQFKYDDYNCKVRHRDTVYLDGLFPVHHTDKGMYYRCMELKGWTR